MNQAISAAIDDPFWTCWPGELQLRDALAGVLHERGWTVQREVCVGEGLRVDLLARRSDQPDFHVIELKYRIRTLLEAERSLAQCARYVVAIQAGVPEAKVVGYVTAGGFGAVSDATLGRFYQQQGESALQMCRPDRLPGLMDYWQEQSFDWLREMEAIEQGGVAE